VTLEVLRPPNKLDVLRFPGKFRMIRNIVDVVPLVVADLTGLYQFLLLTYSPLSSALPSSHYEFPLLLPGVPHRFPAKSIKCGALASERSNSSPGLHPLFLQ
jgi:hypothetical protein